MISERRHSRVFNALWLVSGIAVGAFLTTALVVGAIEMVGGDPAGQVMKAPSFIEESTTTGMDHVYDGGFHFFVGGGVAVFDCNDDRRPELFVAGGTQPSALYLNESRVGAELEFSPLPHPVTDLTKVTGAYPLDVDSDGKTDLVVLRVGENAILRGLGDCRFERANELWGVDGGNAWTVAFSATWEVGETLPTLAFGNYLDLTADDEPADRCADHFLFRPEGALYAEPMRLTPGWCTLSILFSDWNRTGRRDLRMTNDRHYYRDGEEQLWRVDPGETPRLYTREDGWQKMQIWGMGIASHDVTGNGLPEVYLTSQGDNKLQTLASGGERPTYEDIALARGANAHRPFSGDTDRPSTAWHAEFADVNNDGLMDLFVTKGNVEVMPEFAADDPNNLLLAQPDGTFVEGAEEAGLIDYARSRGAAVVDLNLDGLLDVVVVDRRESARVWRNAGSGDAREPRHIGNWLAIDVQQPSPNVDAIGAWIEVRLGDATIRRELTLGGGHAGDQLGWSHIGLGEVSRADIRVQWPDGEFSRWMTVDANQFLIVERGSPGPRPWSPLQD